ncbi:glycine--tRNA ligase 1, mitochondrial [Dorcoceras hygrometricum]|uniref:Glycine--tRNA ligase 1, mitochondrial n=1 Tax=Dorcoceras hygrometricum TaxID=472368 RepID=A0A2Z7A9P2_9LAMI|nr:glycine--tRNA ligase 1, mitochondrial [Dorcoceras hygrometricum]
MTHVLERKVNAVSSKENVRCEFVYGSSELNLLYLPFFRKWKDLLEYFDYSDPRCNPILRPAAARTLSNHCTPAASCECLTHFFTTLVRKSTDTSLTSQCKRQHRIV